MTCYICASPTCIDECVPEVNKMIATLPNEHLEAIIDEMYEELLMDHELQKQYEMMSYQTN